MVENKPWLTVLTHLVLLTGLFIVAFPVYVAVIASTHGPSDFMTGVIPMLPGNEAIANFTTMMTSGNSSAGAPPLGPMMFNSLIMALAIAIGKITISIISAFAIVYFRFPFRQLAFWLIFITLMLPVEVRILPTYKVVADLGMLNSYSGLAIPLIASATATFLFRQFFLTVPEELMEAARVDGAGPMKFFRDILLPLSRTNIAALFVILFIYGWNQYLWPLLITTKPEMNTIVMGIKQMFPSGDDIANWPVIMATTLLAMLPPVAVVIFMQGLFVKGLVESEK